MSSHFFPQPYRASEPSFTNSAFGPEDDDAAPESQPVGNGWFDSSFELRKGLEVIEWVLPDIAPSKPSP